MIYMLKNENVKRYTIEIKKLIEEAKANGVEIQPYEKKIEKGASEFVVERGIAIYACDVEVESIPTWKFAE